ncbi:glycoside hydrolase family 38 N-terminal domain-containing protein [Paenibacillus mendelii]|uniref:Glycoside hydrolase n=1 Tax=Paenibacillus mendelii TaxID=206163 RepID=A0ABV6J4C6_9BACL|nr:glycoside hydrolase [Paenibacillus mendelii]MCQ6561742.1 glycoside hydrolase [Paenibacillus mendelii]
MTKPKNWTIYAIQHSHTDVGYTERQEKIRQYHVDFIRQALTIVREIRSGNRPDWQGYKWVCETFWPIESFLSKATDSEREELAEAFRQGDFGISGTYLNMSELVGKELLEAMLKRICDYAQSIDVKVESAMTADITGFGWGYGQVLADKGIKNLITCIHTHHSMFPLRKKQTPFWWETPGGDRILTWSGEHYVFGNDLGIMPGLGGSYTIRDELDTSRGVSFEQAEIRILRYLEQLEKDGYPFLFVPVMLSGLPTDNGSPNPLMMEFVHKWNEKHGGSIRIQPATLDDFFAEVRKSEVDIPVYRGDWPDWWTDGTISTPMHVQVFREAQRVYEKVRQLDPKREIIKEEDIKRIEDELVLFAEHTWGYHSSVSEPWNPFVQELGVRKDAFAANASTLAHTALYDILEAKGDALLAPDRPLLFRIHNPYSYVQEDYAHFIMEFWHHDEIKRGFEVVDKESGEVYPSQLRIAPRGVIVTIPVTLQPGEERTIRIRPVIKPGGVTAFGADLLGSDRILDIEDPNRAAALNVTYTSMDTPFARIEWRMGDGITSWMDKRTGQEMLRPDRNHHAFSPVYDVTKAAKVEEMNDIRRKMGRNRKGPDATVSVGELVKAEIIDKGDVYATVRLTYNVNGCSHYSLLVTGYADKPRVDVAVRMHKESVWDPENVYISIPFGAPIRAGEQELWIDKLQAPVRPRIDQLPGSLIDYYCLDEGAVYVAENEGVAIAMPDTPLIQLGSLRHEFRLLQGDEGLQDDPAHLYAWPMNNYWETNFRATLGGFYEFRYFIAWGEAYGQPAAALEACRGMNAGILAWRVK